MPTISYRFMPWVRRGLARAHDTPDGPSIMAPPVLNLELKLQADEKGAVTTVSGKPTVRLYSPGDIIGIDTRLIVRTDPKPFATNFEPNYLALVEFDPPDFPWMFTPAKADSSRRLRPWLVLLVLDRDRVRLPRLQPGAPLPSITIPSADTAAELPNLADAWMWAHAQAASGIGVTDPKAPQKLANEMKADPSRNVSRLIAPRRLIPNKNWFACLVPTFAAGRDRGLGIEPAGDPNASLPLTPAWASPASGDVTLPVYFHWEFSTGAAGDFETLVRRLKFPSLYKSESDAAFRAKLKMLGTVPVAVDADRLLTTTGQPTQTRFEGALTSTQYSAAEEPEAQVAAKLAAIVNAPETFNLATGPATRTPTVAPPIYGAWHARRHKVHVAKVGKKPGACWLDELNLDPRFRIAAGYGASLVREYQETYMQSCWRQIGDVLKAERQFAFAALAREASRVLQTKLTKLPDDRLLMVLAPARSRIVMAKGADTVLARVAATSLPDAIADPALRRLTSPQRPALKAAVRRAGASQSVGTQMANMFATLTQAMKNPDAIDPNRYVPDGILGTKTFDGLALPADLNAMVDLTQIGLPGKMRASAIKELRDSAKLATTNFTTRGRPQPSLTKIREEGLITETHLVRFAELTKAARIKVPFSALTTELTKPALREAQSVAISLRTELGKPVIQMQPVQIDVRTGNLASVAPMAAAATITVAQPVRDTVVLNRYAKAFPSYSRLWTNPAATAQVNIQAIDFVLAPVAVALRGRTDPGLTVPARLASLLTVNGERLAFDPATRQMKSMFMDTKLATVPDSPIRFVLSRFSDRVMAYPQLNERLSDRLAKYERNVFLPGADDIPNDFVILLKTNSRFTESFLAGLNYEMCRELLWRGFPTDQRGTPFRYFWDRIDDKPDIAPLHLWNSALRLGDQPGGMPGGSLVFLIRSQLLKRFPNTIIYAHKKEENQNKLKEPVGKADHIKPPILGGVIQPDITYVGFEIGAGDLENWCIVLEEHMTEPRFGFDEPDRRRRAWKQEFGWKDVDWGQVNVAPGGFLRLANLRRDKLPTDVPENAHAGDAAHALMQRPFRAYFVGAKLK
jgi:hypothetical protein